jgi:cytochrome b561
MHAEQTADNKYNLLAMAFHWLMFLGLAAAVVMAWIMTEIDGITPFKLRLYNYHKWLGVSLFVLAAARLLWRWIVKPPRLPATMSARDQTLAHLGHAALYGLMFSIPLIGYFYSLAAGYPVVWFGVIELPVLIGPSPTLKPILKEAHELFANALIFLAAAHALIALKHHFINKDSVLSRMVPFLKAPLQ